MIHRDAPTDTAFKETSCVHQRLGPRSTGMSWRSLRILVNSTIVENEAQLNTPGSSRCDRRFRSRFIDYPKTFAPRSLRAFYGLATYVLCSLSY